MEIETSSEYLLEYPEIPIELIGGMMLDLFIQEKMSFVPLRCLIDQLGNYMIVQREVENCIDLSLASDVRKNFIFQDEKIKVDEENVENTLTIVYGLTIANVKYLHIRFESEDICEIWYSTICLLLKRAILLNPSVIYLLQREYYRLMAVAQCTGKLSISSLTLPFNSQSATSYFTKSLSALELIKEDGSELIKISQFTFQKFLDVYGSICPRPELDECFKDMVSSKSMIMSIKEFIGFVKNHQKDKLSLSEIKSKVSIFEPDAKMVQKEYISFKCFYLYLISEYSKIVDDVYFTSPHNLDKPLSCYYINSSHNTYLTGFQIYSNSSVEIYRQCLLRGCRCVEIDCWDGPNSEPMVTHGYAMCTNVDFKDVIIAIKESAFVNSDLPVIISIENHCGSKNQAKMAHYFKEIFGNLLLAEVIPNQPIEEGVEFPSPNTLKMKIILKGKIRDVGDKETTKSSVEVKGRSLEGLNYAIPDENVQTLRNKISLNSSLDINELDNDDKIIEIVDAIENITLNSSVNQIETESSLTSIINYGRAYAAPDFSENTHDTNYIKIVSINESNAERQANENPVEFLNFNKHSLTRVYPKNSRIYSTNYNPMPFWNVGCQLVALNLQTSDVYEQLNFTKFCQNSGLGYVLKPNLMINSNKKFNPISANVIEDVVPLRAIIKLISAQFVIDKSTEIIACIETFGLPKDQYSFKVKVKKVLEENIIFEKNEILLEKIILPQQAYIRFSILDKEWSTMYQRILPILALKNGYRHIPMRNKFNNISALTTIFVDIKTDLYTPKDFEEFESSLINPIQSNTDFQNKSSLRSSILFINKSEILFPSLIIPNEDDINKKVNDVIKECMGPFFDYRGKNKSIKNNADSMKNSKKFQRSKTVGNIDHTNHLIRALQLISQKQKTELKELVKLQKNDLNNLIKMLTNEFLQEQKKIKLNLFFNKDQKEVKLKSQRQTFVEDCTEKRQELVSQQEKAFSAIIKSHKEEVNRLKAYYNTNNTDEIT